MSIDHIGLYWKLPTRLESTLTIFGLTSGTHGASSTVCRSMRSHRPRAASGFLVRVVVASLISRSMRGSQNPAAFAFPGPWTRDAQVSSGSKNPDGGRVVRRPRHEADLRSRPWIVGDGEVSRAAEDFQRRSIPERPEQLHRVHAEVRRWRP